MEYSRKLHVRVDRQMVADEAVDLPRFLDSVYNQMLRNYSLFGAEEKFDIWPEEITLSHIVVYNGQSRTYTRAMIDKDEQGNVTGFSNIEQVRRMWVPFGEDVERDARQFDTVMIERKTTWAGLI